MTQSKSPKLSRPHSDSPSSTPAEEAWRGQACSLWTNTGRGAWRPAGPRRASSLPPLTLQTKPHPHQGTSPPSEPPEGPANLTLHLPLPTESGLSPKTTDNPKGTAFSLYVKLGMLFFIPTLIQSSREAMCVIFTSHEKGHSGVTWWVCCVSTVRYQAIRPGLVYAQCPGNGQPSGGLYPLDLNFPVRETWGSRRPELCL